ncbi:MAG: hypothetical protein IPJ84_04880 [Bdellovibrionales bacterium]|nr:hypothetical protein [Bdellovibrionales bacterium]
MSGFESCWMASRRELRRRLFIVVLLALAALAATQYWGRRHAHVDPSQAAERAEARASGLKLPAEKAPLHTIADLVELGVGPEGEGLRPEEMVAEAQKALAQGLEARP